ncbi:MAG: hypothetical protein AAGI37_15725 [Planctomycetota bacterium]
MRSLLIVLVSLSCLATAPTHAVVVVNPPRPITHEVTVQPIIVSNDDGSNTSNYLTDTLNEPLILSEIREIWAQAGVAVNWLTPNSWNSTFANAGNDGSATRSTADFTAIPAAADAAGVSSTDPTFLDMYFLMVPPGTQPLSTSQGRTRFGDDSMFIHLADTGSFGRPLPNDVGRFLSRSMAFTFDLRTNDEIGNLLGPSLSSGERLNDTQIATVLDSEYVTLIPEPASLVLLAPLLVVMARRQRG